MLGTSESVFSVKCLFGSNNFCNKENPIPEKPESNQLHLKEELD